MSPSALPGRHDLVWLSPRWRESLLAPLSAGALPLARAWLARGLPAVACRLDAAHETAVALGISLPPAPERRVHLYPRVILRELFAGEEKMMRGYLDGSCRSIDRLCCTYMAEMEPAAVGIAAPNRLDCPDFPLR